MTGLLLIGVMLIWLVACVLLANKFGEFVPKQSLRVGAKFLVAALLLPLPLIDEIVGGVQFAELCRQHETIQVNREKVKGTTVYFEPIDAVYIQTLWVPVRRQLWRYVVPETGETAISYETFHATGGWLIRALRISEGNVPLTFKDSCVPKEDIRQLFSQLQITALDKQSLSQKGK
jgi:hypothetical protein